MRVVRRLLTLGAIAGLVAVPASLPAIAQSGTAASVTHRQSVQTFLSPEGEPRESRVFTQLAVAGEGRVEVELPSQSTRGLRNLEGFARPRVDGDRVVHVVEATPRGTHVRTVADHDGDQPVSISVAVTLDGEPIAPGDLRGRSGRVEVAYTVTNLTNEPVELTYFDGQGRPATDTFDVALPMVGSLATTLDGRFVDVTAPGAAVAGDGRGNTVVNWSLLLFEPLGDEVQTVSWSATVSDAVLPAASAQVLPVDSRSFRSLRSTQDAYRDANRGLKDLTNGALVLDGNVKLLASGADQLLDGLVQLRDGASRLQDGLADTAAPGARQLSDGLGQARAGGQELADGLGELESGAQRLSDGLGDARAGGTRLRAGLGELADGGAALRSGADRVAGGMAEVDANLQQLAAGAEQVHAGLTQIAAGTSAGFPAAIAGIPQLAGGAAQLRDNVYAGAGTGCTPGAPGCGLLASLQAATAVLNAIPAAGQNQATLTAAAILTGSIQSLTANQPQIDALVAGAQGLNAQLVPGLQAIDGALGSPERPGPLLGGAGQVAGGAARLQAEGTAPLAAGSKELAAGAKRLADGAKAASDGSAALTDGLGQLDDGAGQLAAGAGRAAAGSGDLADGLVQLDDGGARLAAGLGDAADGSGQLAEGLESAADGGGRIAEGTVALSERGMANIISGTTAGAAGPSRLLEQAMAVDRRARDGGALPYGTVAGADATAVFSYELAGVGLDGGPTTSTLTLVTLLAFALVGGLGVAVRRRIM